MNIYVHTLLRDPLKEQLRETLKENYLIHFRKSGNHDNGEAKSFEGADAILGNPPVLWFSQHPPVRLKLWQLDSAGFDQYRSVRTDARVANMGDWFARPCAETIIAGVLALYRGIDKLVMLQQEQKWVGAPLREELQLLYRKRVIVLGAGTIGIAVRAILSGFGAFVRTVARTSPQAEIHTREELLAALPETDLVINTLPGAAGLFVDREFLEKMKKGSVYANVGRGTTTDEAALTGLLEAGHLSGAVLDVNAVEPLPPASPLWRMKQVILTQHTGGGQFNEDRGKVLFFLENLAQIEKNAPIFHEVDLKRGY